MRIYIPTYGRVDKQVTLNMLPGGALMRDVTLVVQKRDQPERYQSYVKGLGCSLLVLPPKIQTIGPTRDWIIANHDVNKYGYGIVMIDDDVHFDTRRKDDPTKFLKSTDEDVKRVFAAIHKEINKGAVHVGVLAREGGNRVTQEKIYATRMMRVLAYNVAVLRKEKIKFSRIPVMEDFDVTLQLLRLGCANTVLCNWVQGQGSSNAAGGCSTYRTPELQTRAAQQLQKLHPAFVKVVKKTTKAAWGGGERTDVTIQWKKAYESSKA